MRKFSHSLKVLFRQIMPSYWWWKIRTWMASGCKKGNGVYIHPTVQIVGAENVSIGNNVCISEYTWLNVNHRTKGNNAIIIEDNCFIGRRNFFSAGDKIVIGPYTLTTIDCKFLGSSHIVDNPILPYITAGTTSTDNIRVGANCFFGASSTILGNVTIGHGSIIGANSLVLKSVPPFSMVLGNPAIISRRYSFSKKSWIASNVLVENDLNDNPDENAYLELLKLSHPKVFMPLIATGSDWGNL